MSIRTRIALFGLAVVLVVLTCVSGALYALFAGGLPGSQDKRLAARATEAVHAVSTADGRDFTAGRPLAPVDPAVDDDMFVIVLDAGGTVLSYTGGDHPSLPRAVLDAAGRTGTAAATVPIDGVRVRVSVKPWHRPDLGRDGYVAAAQPVRRRVADLQSVGVALVVSGILTVLAAAPAIWLVTGRALRPLRQLTATADEIGRSPDRTRRLPPTSKVDDLGRLTASFNAMLDRLEYAHRHTAGALTAQQRFTADASHELRTPLSTVRNNVGFLRANPGAAPDDRAAALADIDAEAVRMSRLVDDLLTLARADGGVRLTPSTVDVGELAHEICRKATTAHPDRQIHCSGAPTVLRVDRDALSQLLWILLDNAVRHTADDGNIWVAVTSRGPGRATLQVADDGEGIPPGEEARIFERFHQADPARRHGGAGLGLSIAAWVAAAHGGTVTAGNNDRGGATFTVAVSSIS
jgi:signal transduction histidine kinase